jgi:hypothetical protein
MKVQEAIKQKVISCGIDTTHVTDRRSHISLYPDARISIGNEGNITNLNTGLQIIISCRHNGSTKDILDAFEDAKKLLAGALID